MTEAQITGEMIHWLRRMSPGMYLKHCDRATIGLPDISATTKGRTTWLEVKLIQPRDINKVKMTDVDTAKIQLMLMKKLQEFGRAYYIIFIYQRRSWWTVIATPVDVERCNEMTKWAGKRFDIILELL